MSEGAAPKPMRDSQGRWLPGATGNAKGKPLGVRNRVSTKILNRLADETDNLLDALLKKAKEGDVRAGTYLLSVIVPRAKFAAPDPDDIAGADLDLTSADGLSRAHAGVIAAMAQGKIDADVASSLSALLQEQRKQVEAQRLEAKLTALENQRLPDLTDLNDYLPATDIAEENKNDDF